MRNRDRERNREIDDRKIEGREGGKMRKRKGGEEGKGGARKLMAQKRMLAAFPGCSVNKSPTR